VTEEEPCLECPATTHTIVEGAVSIDTCICQPDFYDWTRWEIACIEADFDIAVRYQVRNEGSPINDKCWPCWTGSPERKICKNAIKCWGNNSISVMTDWWAFPLDEAGNEELGLQGGGRMDPCSVDSGEVTLPIDPCSRQPIGGTKRPCNPSERRKEQGRDFGEQIPATDEELAGMRVCQFFCPNLCSIL
jgi:hypothetical protein